MFTWKNHRKARSVCTAPQKVAAHVGSSLGFRTELQTAAVTVVWLLFKSVRKKISGYRKLARDCWLHKYTQNTHQPQRPHIRSPQSVYSVKRTERSAKASMAGVVTAIRRHHRGSCVFVIFCIHYVCCWGTWASNYPAPSVPQGWNIPSLRSDPSLPLPSAMRENSSPGKITSRDGHNLVEARFSPGCGTFGAKTFISTIGKVMMSFTTELFHVDMCWCPNLSL